MENGNAKKTITDGDIKRIYDETIDDDTPATDFQKERVLMRLGRTPQNIEFVKVMNFSFAQKILDFYKEQIPDGSQGNKAKSCAAGKGEYFCPVCKHGFDSPKRANGCLDFALLALFISCLIAIPFTFGASIAGCALWAILGMTCCPKVCPYCGSKNFFKQNTIR